MSEKSIIQVGMVGFGTIGQGVYRLLEKNRPCDRSQDRRQAFKIKKIVDKDLDRPRDVNLPEELMGTRISTRSSRTPTSTSFWN